MVDLTHASFFSGVGGLDMGLDRAGWRTVSFSEIDPYASADLAERWPGIPNLGDIVRLAERFAVRQRDVGEPVAGSSGDESAWHTANLWSGGFPCQDLSVAGKRRGFSGQRSSLAFAFLDLVERFRPAAILFENVPGLMSSNSGRDLGALLDRFQKLGYVGAGRTLDSQYFGVPQRRRRVFILAFDARGHLGTLSAAEILSVGTRCERHPATGHAKGQSTPRAAGDRAAESGWMDRLAEAYRAAGSWEDAVSAIADPSGGDGSRGVARTLTGTMGKRHDDDTDTLIPIGAPTDSDRMRAPDGMARRPHDRQRVAQTIRAGGHGSPGIGRDGDEERLVLAPTLLAPGAEGGRRDRMPITLAPTLRVGPGKIADGGPGDTVPIVTAYRKSERPKEANGVETWIEADVANTLNGFDVGDIRSTHAIIGTIREHVRPGSNTDHSVLTDNEPADDPLLPLGLDSHRYRCCGNGVVANVSEWIGKRLADAIRVMEGSVDVPSEEPAA